MNNEGLKRILQESNTGQLCACRKISTIYIHIYAVAHMCMHAHARAHTQCNQTLPYYCHAATIAYHVFYCYMML